jgi:hypothetical protein
VTGSAPQTDALTASVTKAYNHAPLAMAPLDPDARVQVPTQNS